jgi:excisionase family DNA binding protein
LATTGTQVVQASRESESNMSQSLTRDSAQKPSFLTVEELAEMLRVEVRTVYSWVTKGSVPFRKAGRRTVFLLDEIMEWTEEQSSRR